MLDSVLVLLVPVSELDLPRTRTLVLNTLPYVPLLQIGYQLTSRSPTETLTAREDQVSTGPVTSTKTHTSTSLPALVDPLPVVLPTPTSSTPTDPELLATRMVLPIATPI